jgi:hypothetical protein
MGFRSSFGSTFGTLAGLGLGSVFVYRLPAAARLPGNPVSTPAKNVHFPLV